MINILKKYKNSGHFIFHINDNLKKVCNAPNLPGIYLFYGVVTKEKLDLKYIGKSGSIKRNGDFKNQLLCGRICNVQDNVRREIYLKQRIQDEKLTAIKIEWYVTFENQIRHLPSYVEGLLMQFYFNSNNKLPPWNNSY